MNITSHSIHCAALRACGSALVAAITAAVLPTAAFELLPPALDWSFTPRRTFQPRRR